MLALLAKSWRRRSLLQRWAIWRKARKLANLRHEISVEQEELKRTNARIGALDYEIIRVANELATLKLK